MKKIIKTDNAPAPVGPYSQAVRYGDILYLSGQIAIDPASNTMITDGVEAETEQVLKNIAAVLTAAGSSLDKVLKTTCFLANMDDFGKFNAIYEKYFGESKPARSTVQAMRLPKGALVEVDLIAYI